MYEIRFDTYKLNYIYVCMNDTWNPNYLCIGIYK